MDSKGACNKTSVSSVCILIVLPLNFFARM